MQPISMTYRGITFTIPARRAFEIGEEVENIISLGEIQSWGNRVPFHRVARAYGAMLRFAGCKVENGEVLQSIMENLAEVGIAKANGADIESLEIFYQTALGSLTLCLMGGAPRSDATPDDDVKTPAS